MRKVLMMCLLVALIGSQISYAQDPQEPTAPDLEALEKRIAELSNQVLKLQEEKAQLEGRLDQISRTLEQVATYDGQRYVPGLRGAMDNSAMFRKDLYDVTSATVDVENNTGRREALFLNGVRWNFPPGQSSIDVPFGPVRVEFVNFHHDKHWTYTERDWQRIGNRARLKLQIMSGTLRPGQ
jgi:hypothetical protein